MKDTKKKKSSIIYVIIILTLLLDQLTKFIISKNLALNQTTSLIKNILYLTYIQNSGAAFGLFQEANQLLIWFSIIVIGFILYYYDKILTKNKLTQTSVALLFAGTLSNLIDRIRLGYVIDFIDFRIWPAFNIADISITIGIIGIIIYMIKEKD